jgi:hypothetical protein
MFLPFVIIYKLFTAGAKQLIFDVKTIMKLLKKIFLCTINQLFWKFLREFWKRVKADLKNFLKRIIQKILRDKFRRYYIVIAALIALLKRIIETGINNCADLIGAIGAAIDGALSASGGLNIPNVLLLIADKLPGFSAVKTSMDVNEKMEAMGIPTGDVNGEPNYHLLSHSAAIEGLADNLAKTPFISIPKASGVPVGALMKH